MDFDNEFGNEGDGHNYEEWPEENMDNEPPPDSDFYMGYRNLFDNNRGGFRRGRGYGPFGPPSNFCPRGQMGPLGPPGPPGPQFMWGRGFGPGGPPMQHRPPRERDNKPMRYLIRCGVPKEHLKGLPKVLLRLMDPEYCGVCAMGFDNFTSSRLHYISKNHLKNQKKWLTQQAEVGSTRPKERPMKSRDLYCELCDVHITSKVHAESHYSGKAHRAIVEGRKNPKNPYLLQRGMRDRVEQLIRREKKCLKPIEEVEAKDVVKEAKTSAAELYCDICKTSVTCSEQMTMHLNGKRHLSKEKQHILKMMKGEAPKKGKEEAVDADKAEHAEAETTGDQEEKPKDQNDDWVDGDGAWDDDPQ